MRVNIDWTIKVSDVLTSMTIIVSVFALLLSFTKDREARATEQANRVRVAAAAGITKLDRWQALHLSLFQEMQPAFVELSESLAEKYDVQSVRDQFWKRTNSVRTSIGQKVLDEQLGAAYSELLSQFPAAREKFTAAFAQLSRVEAAVMLDFFIKGQREILLLEGKQKTYTTPVLGNALREVATEQGERLKADTETVIAPVREYLFDVISLLDEEILSASRARRKP